MLGHPSVRPPIRPSARDDKQSMQGISPILAVPFLARRRAAWEQFGILRGVNFWGMREFILLRDGPPLPNGPNLQNWKLYLGVSRAELQLKVIDLFHGGDSFFFLNEVSRVKVEDRRARGHERVDRNFY